MPALFTHYEFGKDILKKINKNIKTNIKSEINYYNMFNQGFDNLYFSPSKWNHFRKLAVKAHSYRIDLFFKNMFEYIIENNLTNEYDLTNMIYGFINHYTVDTIIHPFINAQVKRINISHTRIEFMLDSKIYNNDPRIYNTLITRLKFSKYLNELINYTFLNTYNEPSVGKYFNKSHNTSYYIYRYFVNDKKGKKRNIYKVFDFFIRAKKFKLHENTFYVDKFDKRILNLEKNTWHNPKNNKEVYNYSYNELYDICLTICRKLITLAYNVLYNNGNLDEFIKVINKINIKNIEELLSL